MTQPGKPSFTESPGAPARWRFIGIFFLGLFLITLSGCRSSSSRQAPPPDLVRDHLPYTLGPGDRVRITVFEHDNLSGTFKVDDAGRISLPLIRGINVEGLTLPDLEQLIAEQLVKNYIADPKVSTDLIELRPFCIFGEVRNPGCYSYIHGMRGSKAIALAGGYAYRARKNELLITREDGKRITGTHDTPIYAGDTIEVSERLF